ncbi:MAG TPA: molybdenum cofactor guanylyltransferase [Egibacteraceae bacterium]|nr:molybdenum cofactor guanylyltransferase [Egibacteraceae bacterium]
MDETPGLTGLVLAGGRSTRMGRDKALLAWDGTPLVDRVAEVLAECCDEVLIASGDGTRLGRPHEIADAVPSAGPLGGLLAGMEAAAQPLVAVVAVDMPHASAGVLRALAGALGDAGAAVPLVEGRTHPLHAVYRASCAATVRACLDEGQRSVMGLLARIDVREAGPEVWGSADPAGRFATNINRPEEFPRPD